GTIGAREQLLRQYFAVARPRRGQAVVAIAATLAMHGLAEIAEQPLAPALCGFRETHQRIELADRDPLELVRCGGLVDHAALLHDVREAVGHPGRRRLAVAAGATGLLVV